MVLVKKVVTVLILIAGWQAQAASLERDAISVGPHAGKTIFEVIENNQTPVLNNGNFAIPAPAAKEAIRFFDRFGKTLRQYLFWPLLEPKQGLPMQFNPVAEATIGPSIGNENYIIIFDLNLHSSLPRLHVINLKTGEITSTEAAHGRGTDCGGSHLGYACRFISDRESTATPLGFFSTGESYEDIQGPKIRLNGLEAASGRFSGNDVPSALVIHAAPYVTKGYAGRSLGCPAVNMEFMKNWVDRLKGGALFYFYHSSLEEMGREPEASGLQ